MMTRGKSSAASAATADSDDVVEDLMGDDNDDEEVESAAAPPKAKASAAGAPAAASSPVKKAKPDTTTVASASPSISTPASTKPAAASTPAAASASASASASSSSSSSTGASQQAARQVALVVTTNPQYVMVMASGKQSTEKVWCDSLKVKTANIVAGKQYLMVMIESHNAKKEATEYKMLAQPTGPIVARNFLVPEVTQSTLDVESLAGKKHRVCNVMGVVHSEPEELVSSGGVPYKNVSFVLRTGSGDNDVTELKLTLWSNKPNERQFGNNPYEVVSNIKVGTAVLVAGALVRDNGRGAPALSAGQFQSLVTLKADAEGTPTAQFKDLEDWYAKHVTAPVSADFTLPPDMEFEMLDVVDGAPQPASAASAASGSASDSEATASGEKKKRHNPKSRAA